MTGQETLTTPAAVGAISPEVIGFPGRVASRFGRQLAFQGFQTRTVHKPSTRRVLSPLRYPGGKQQLAPYMQQVLLDNDLRPELFLEPYAGGAGVSLELLEDDLVDRVWVNDRDPMVCAFWQTVFTDTDWLCEQIEQIDVDLETWRRMKHGRCRSRRSLALACLFLNRTSFNGSLNHRTGPIGGQKQAGASRIGCRFPRKELIKRIQACQQHAERVVSVSGVDGVEAIRQAKQQANKHGWGVFVYLDPPFWAKSDRLYRYAFTKQQHEDLTDSLAGLEDPWVLSYDNTSEIKGLYSTLSGVSVTETELAYTATRHAPASELLISNLRLGAPGEWSTITSRGGLGGKHTSGFSPTTQTSVRNTGSVRGCLQTGEVMDRKTGRDPVFLRGDGMA